MNRSNKLSLFLGLGCKPLKDVVLHHPNWTIHQGNRTLQAFEDRANEALSNPDVYIEAIPEELSDYERNRNILKISGVIP